MHPKCAGGVGAAQVYADMIGRGYDMDKVAIYCGGSKIRFEMCRIVGVIDDETWYERMDGVKFVNRNGLPFYEELPDEKEKSDALDR